MDILPMNNILCEQTDGAIATFVFAHGAGAGKDHEFMVEITRMLLARKINVIRFDFPYMAKRLVDGKKYPPNRMPVLLEAYQSVVDSYQDELPLFIGGKSMGSRVAMTLLSENDDRYDKIKGAICLGYPFHPPKKLDKLRLTPLQENRRNTLICQGSRDTLGNQEEILGYSLPSHYQLCFLPDGDHDLKPRVKSGHTHLAHKEKAVNEMVTFMRQHCE